MDINLWIILILVFLIGELVTGGFYLLSLGLGSLVALILNYLGFSLSIQILGLICATIIFLIISRPIGSRFNKTGSKRRSNTERLIGESGVVIESIKPSKNGKVKVNNEIWLAKGECELNKNTKVTIKDIEGVKLIVEKEE